MFEPLNSVLLSTVSQVRTCSNHIAYIERSIFMATVFLFMTLILKAAIILLEYPNETVSCWRTSIVRFAVWCDDYA